MTARYVSGRALRDLQSRRAIGRICNPQKNHMFPRFPCLELITPNLDIMDLKSILSLPDPEGLGQILRSGVKSC